ncbi:hypothetical protein GH714_011029 [Hevea brasiliensis]|uniref:CW7 n=1 Tax=Hevea brasiliensis TaxID=3981 RepID=A0A6A6NGL9_HEVBR|nr:hypothetical protein GH714_011029 [Hevea brasiliensis]
MVLGYEKEQLEKAEEGRKFYLSLNVLDCGFVVEESGQRHELLSMVKKHSTLLGKGTVHERDPSDVEMDGRFWYDMLDLYFIRGKESRGRQDDDLVFFVRKMGTEGYGFNDNVQGLPPYFVRRWAAKVVKTVYASPSRVDFHLDSKKEVETTPAYPDICFAVDDFDSTFDAVVLTETDHCYCVLLNAHDGAAFPSENESPDNTSSTNSPLEVDTNSGKMKNSKLTLFSGFVSYQMVREAYDAGKSQFGSLLSLSHSPGKTDKLYMKGPGGRGEVKLLFLGLQYVNIHFDDSIR